MKTVLLALLVALPALATHAEATSFCTAAERTCPGAFCHWRDGAATCVARPDPRDLPLPCRIQDCIHLLP